MRIKFKLRSLLLILHLAFAIWGQPLLPANIASDSGKFIGEAAYLNFEWAYGSSQNYSRLLSFLFGFFGSQNLIARVVSSVGFYVFLIYLQKLMVLLGVNQKNRNRGIFFIVLNPAFFVYTSAALREAWLIALMAIGIYHSLLYIQGHHSRDFLLLVMAFGCMGWLHSTYSILLIPFIVLPFLIGSSRPFHVLILISSVYLLLSFSNEVGGEKLFGGYLSEIISGDIIYQWYSVRLYLDTRTDASNFYGMVPDSSQIQDVFLTMPLMFIHYLIAPLSTPALIDSLIDYGYSAFSFMRLILILVGGSVLLKDYLTHRLSFATVYLWLFWFVSVFLWSIGTANYGTALRHNVTTDWLLVLLIAMGYSAYVTKEPLRSSVKPRRSIVFATSFSNTIDKGTNFNFWK